MVVHSAWDWETNLEPLLYATIVHDISHNTYVHVATIALNNPNLTIYAPNLHACARPNALPCLALPSLPWHSLPALASVNAPHIQKKCARSASRLSKSMTVRLSHTLNELESRTRAAHLKYLPALKVCIRVSGLFKALESGNVTTKNSAISRALSHH